MKEIEVLVEIDEKPDEIMKKMEKFEYIGNSETIDVYYYDPKRDNLKPNDKLEIYECFRLRTKNNENYITYKTDNFDADGKWLYSDEYETKVEDINVLKNIIKKLGYKELLTINNNKMTYNFGKYEIVFEMVKDLGCFLEVEYCTNDEVDVKKIKQEIRTFIKSLNLKVSKELNIGKPELMLKKQKYTLDKEL